MPQPGSTRSHHAELTRGPSTAPGTSPLPPMVPSPPAEGLITGNFSLPIGKSQEGPSLLPPVSEAYSEPAVGWTLYSAVMQVLGGLVFSRDAVLSVRAPGGERRGRGAGLLVVVSDEPIRL